MTSYIIRRLFYMVPTLLIISIISFIIIQLPPGDFITSYIASLQQSGTQVSQSIIDSMRQRYGLNQPIYVQYFKWITGVVQGDLGMSFERNKPVAEIIGERITLTAIVSITSMAFSWVFGLIIGAYSAVRQYSLFDYIWTFFGFLGRSIPNFMLALIFMYISVWTFGTGAGGLFSPQYANAPWSMAKVVDLLKHLWVPVIVVGTAGTAGVIRIMRANLLDQLGQPYVKAARAKGLREWKLILKYPFRVAINPLISNLGFLFPRIVSGTIITGVVLGLPTTGPMLLQALLAQDMYLAGSFILIIASLTVFGVLISDILLAWSDPRIRYD